MTPRRALLAAWGLFAALLLLMVGHGLIGVVTGVRSELEGFGDTTIGLIVAAYFGGFLIGSQVAPRIMAKVGHVRAFAGLSSLLVAATLAQSLLVDPVLWMALRLVFGLCMSSLYVVVESWLNEAVTNENRGRVLAVYMVVGMGGIGLGQLLLGTASPMTQSLFILGAILLALAIVPISLAEDSSPEFVEPPRLKARHIWKVAPLGIFAATMVGIANSALLGLAGVYATQVGLDSSQTAIFVGAAAFGSVALQWPIGHISDVIGRRPTILGVTTLAGVVALIAMTLTPGSSGMLGAMFLMGGLSYPMYSLALSHVVDVLPKGQAVSGSMVIVFVTGIGSVIGPVLTSVVMGNAGPNGFWWTMAAVHALIALFALMRLLRRRAISRETPEPYVAVPARSTYLIGSDEWARGAEPIESDLELDQRATE
ncbi:MAG: MFS transporter [Acidimicrobiia bacterium]